MGYIQNIKGWKVYQDATGKHFARKRIMGIIQQTRRMPYRELLAYLSSIKEKGNEYHL